MAARWWPSWQASTTAIRPRPCAVASSRRRAAPSAPADDEYYWVDLIGCALYSDADGEPRLLGVVDEVFDNGAHAVLKVLRQQIQPGQPGPVPLLDPKGRPLEELVPFVRAHIRHVDLAARRIDSDWPLDY